MDSINQIIDTRLEQIQGWCTTEKARAMADIAAKNDVTHFLELGVYCGRSLMPVALTIKTLQASRGVPTWVFGIDAWNGAACSEGLLADEEVHKKWWLSIDQNWAQQSANEMLRNFDLTDIVTLVKVSSADFHTQVADQSLDMLHQDGNHSELISCLEVSLYYNKVKPGGWWVFDDTDWETTKPAQKALEAHGYVCRQDHVKWKVYQRQA